MQPIEDVPRWPSGGNRREIERRWLRRLEQQGPPPQLGEPTGEAPPALYVAIREFNAGAFWECHETLEDVWRSTPYPLRFFYHAIIKTAVGFHHLGRHNRHGARAKLSDCVRLLLLFPSEFMGVRTGRLQDDASGWLARVDGAVPVVWATLDALPRPVIRLTGGQT